MTDGNMSLAEEVDFTGGTYDRGCSRHHLGWCCRGNSIGLLIMYQRYLQLPSASAAFTSEVVGYLAAVDESGRMRTRWD